MGLSPDKVWQAMRGHLQVQMDPATFETWLQDAKFLAFEDGVFKIGVPNRYSKEWLENRLDRLITRSITRIMDTEDFSVEYIIQEPPPPKPRAPMPENSYIPLPIDPPPNHRINAGAVSLNSNSKTPAIRFGQNERLSKDYQLENFVIPPQNRMLQIVSQAMQGPIHATLNPLFIYGGVGTGKTHLLHALGNAIRAHDKEKEVKHPRKVLYVSAATFTNDLVRAIRGQVTDLFRDFYLGPDVLIMDDIQFLANKTSSQEEMLYIFNMLKNQKKQIILSSQTRPQDITNMQDKLRARFCSGLMVEIEQPDYDSRLQILRHKAKGQEIAMPDGYTALIAENVAQSGHSLVGALNQVLALMAVTRNTISIERVEMLLLQYFDTAEPNPTNTQQQNNDAALKEIFTATAEYYQLTLDDLLSKQRHQAVVDARHIAVYLARNELSVSLPNIGRVLGGRSHSTVLNSCRKVEEKLKNDPDFRVRVNSVRHHVRHQMALVR